MTEREKLIQLIKAGHEKASDYFHKEAMAILKQGKSYSSKDRTKTFDEFVADTLIENGIGDIAEWKEKYARLEKSDTSKEDCTIEQHNEIHYLRNKLKQTEKECTERKARAEVLERALRIEIRKSINQYRSDMAFDTGEFNMPWSQPCFVDNDSKEVEDTIQSLLQQAEKEIEEERKGV